MKKTAFIIMTITLLSRVIGFSREIILSYYFGVSDISDIYLVSLTVPNVIFGFIAAGIVTAYIPMQTRVVQDGGDIQGSKFTSNFTNIVLVITTVLLVVGMVYTDELIKVFASGFSSEKLKLTVEFTKISIFGMYFFALVSIFGGFLQTKGNFIVPALIGIPLSFIVIISIVLASKGNYFILAYGTLFATTSQFLIMLPAIKKTKFKYSLVINFKDKKIIRSMQLALPMIIGTSLTQINILVDTTLASSIAVGGVTAISYANRLNLLIQGIFVLSIITALYPSISSFASKNEIFSVGKVLSESIVLIMMLLLPITIGTLIFSEEIVVLLYNRGAFNEKAISLTSSALFFYGFGMIGFGIRQVLLRGFFAMNQTVIPMVNGVVGMLLNIVLNIILSRYLGLGGLALGTSIAALFTALLLGYSYSKSNGYLQVRHIIVSTTKIFVAALIMGVVAYIINNGLKIFILRNIAFVITVGLSAIVYMSIVYLLKLEELILFFDLLKNKIKKQMK